MVEEVIVKTLETTPTNATHWSTRSMAREVRLSDLLCVRPRSLVMVWLWLAGVAVFEVDLQGGAWCAPGAAALPLGVGLDDRQVHQLGRGLLVGEVHAGLDRFADLAVQRFDRVGDRYERGFSGRPVGDVAA